MEASADFSHSDSSKPSENAAEQEKRLATLGALASSISHDLNNLIMTIQGSAEMGLREIGNPVKLTKGLETILTVTRHSRELIEQIQAFSRKEEVVKKVLDLNKVITESRQLIEVRTPPNIDLEFQISEDELFIVSNESQIHQVLLNLYTNAIQAMRDFGGKLSVQLEKIEKSESSPVAQLTIQDSGYGITEEILEKIFDPFFTTKSLGVGTGLGLSVTKNIIDQNGGTIEVTSELKKGTIFRIELPLTEERPSEETTSEETTEYQLPPSHEKKAILLVDDEPFMRGLGMDMLHSLGYRVTVASNGKEALELVQKSPQYFDIILSDSKMPEMTGPELAEKLQNLNPDLPFVLVSAFTDSNTEERLKTIGVSNIVKKPFLISNLEKALTQALEDRSDKPDEST